MIDGEFTYEEGVAKKSVESIIWNFVSVFVKIVLNFIRIYFLARLVSEEIFGIYGYVISIVLVLNSFRYFGTNSAVLNISEFTNKKESALRNFYTLSIYISLIWVLISSLVGYFLIDLSNNVEVFAYCLLILMGFANFVNASSMLYVLREIENKVLAKVEITQKKLRLLGLKKTLKMIILSASSMKVKK